MDKKPQDKIQNLVSRNLALAAVFAALYAVIVIAFAPISIGPVQLRVADVLLPLVILFGWPVILGLGIGTVVGNFGADTVGGLPSASIGLDMVAGSLVNLLVGFLAWKIGQRYWRFRNWNTSWIIATIIQTAIISVVVGGYLSYIFSVPLILSILGVLGGEIIAINIGGFILLNIVGAERSLDAFRARGLQVFRSRNR